MDREERRKRILERGSDRMAFITGKTESISSPTHHQSASLDQIYADVQEEYEASDNTPEKQDSTSESLGKQPVGATSKVEPPLHKREMSLEAIRAPLEPVLKPREYKYFFSSKQVSTCIMTSEGTRMICSVIIALLTVQSYAHFPIFGTTIVTSKSLIVIRPLYTLLLTNFAIVLSLLILEKRRNVEYVVQEEKEGPGEHNANFARVFRVMERSLVFYQALYAIFIDCSVYSVIVICGLSLA
ncbi:hypothetical protein RJ641_024182 [Dillenia turbinata]|uniref:Uncharacterized protein n=1 Tax=Dillenia turbinata TaxID=194707 RepID=A0AAN8YR24_9MAGN